jgi:NTE family protein
MLLAARRALACSSSLLVLLAAPLVRAQCGPPRAPGDPPRVGLALSGGGARGFAHVGVLRALEEAGLRVDCVAGTSMGAVVGAFYASGYSAARIERVLRGIDWARVFSGRSDRSLLPAGRRTREAPPVLRLGFEGSRPRLPGGALGDQRINRVLISELAEPGWRARGDFARLPLPFRAVALDVRSGERVVFASGDLARAVRASLSIPVALPAVPLGERLLVDGGLVDNLPVGVLREIGAEIVIAVDVTSPPRETGVGADALQVALQISDILAAAQNRAFRAPADLTLRPDLGRHTFTDYDALEALLRAGREAAQAQLERLRALAHPAPVAVAPAAAERLEGRVLREIDVRGLRHVEDGVARRILGLRAGQPLDLRAALRGLDALRASDLFRFAWLSFEARGDGLAATFDLLEAEPWSAEVGGGYDEDDGAHGFARLRRRALFGGGTRAWGELRAGDAEDALHARLLVDRLGPLPLGLSLDFLGLADKPQLYDPRGDSRGRALFESRRLRLTLEREVGRAWLLAAGIEGGSLDVVARRDVPLAPARARLRRLHASAAWDTLDDAFAPERGGDVLASFERGVGGWGDSRAAWRASLRGRYVFPFGLRADVWTGLSGGAPQPYDLFRLGGPELVPGRARDEQWGAQVLAGALRGRRKVAGQLAVLARVGAGGAWARRRDVRLGALTLGAGLGLEHPTPLGPLALEYARHTGGRGSLYFSLGVRLPAAPHLGERP